ncbi:MAG: zinc ribbon domain-containing protein [Acidimicrobiales bacterium]
MTDAHPLITIQRLDTEARQLVHRRRQLAQREELAEALAEQAEHQSSIDEIAMRRMEVLARQHRFEDEAATMSTRADRDETRLYSGELQAMKDLQALQDEIAGLRRRQRELEDHALEAMLEADELAAATTELESTRSPVDERVTALTAEIEAVEAEIDAELEGVAAARGEAAAGTDPELLARYERLRPGFGSATVVRFDKASGCSCPSSMPAVEADRVKHCAPGSILDCRECGRIVLR